MQAARAEGECRRWQERGAAHRLRVRAVVRLATRRCGVRRRVLFCMQQVCPGANGPTDGAAQRIACAVHGEAELEALRMRRDEGRTPDALDIMHAHRRMCGRLAARRARP